MSTKSTILNIEKTRSVMDEQVERLGHVPPRQIKVPPISGDACTTTGKILDSTLSAQLATAVDRLRVVNDVEAAIRTTQRPADEPAIIDVADYKEVTP